MKKFGFTLAEVLITLGIIGVVAAMTMPSLITNHQKQVTANKFKREYSILANAFKLAEVENSEIVTPTKGDHKTLMKEYLDKYFFPYVQGEKDYGWMTFNDFYKSAKFSSSNGGHFVGLNDGSVVAFAFPSAYDSEGTLKFAGLDIYLDIDGIKGQNTVGKDRFFFRSNSKTLVGINCSKNTREEIKNECINEQNSTMGWGSNCCGKLIQYDSWQIKDDYPW